MRVVHICPHFFSDGFTYQENLLARQHHVDGHEVLVASTEDRLDRDGRLVRCGIGRSVSMDGFEIHRLAFPPMLPRWVARKVRWMRGLMGLLKEFGPDAAVFHGPQSLSLLEFRNFQRLFPQVHCYVDCHSDPYTTGRTWMSRNVLHRIFYRQIVRATLPELGPLLCISLDVQSFVVEHYGLKPEELEFYPLGGVLHSDAEYLQLRERGRSRLSVGPDTTVLLQTGKMDRHKRLAETLRAFSDAGGPSAVLVIAGTISGDTARECMSLIERDVRIRYLGWVNAEQLAELLCACDLYVQPGGQSATMQLALCARCPVVLRDVPSHSPFVRGNGWLIHSQDELRAVFGHIAIDSDVLADMSRRSFELGREFLDYRKLSKRVLQAREVRHAS
jgi:1,2-diacylglycerol 3-alpha-glucosyltransferase